MLASLTFVETLTIANSSQLYEVAIIKHGQLQEGVMQHSYWLQFLLYLFGK